MLSMLNWIDTANGIVALVTGILGLAGTAIGAYYAIKNWVKVIKNKNKQEIWTLIMEIADAAMTEAESSLKSGEDKKQLVIDSVKAGCKAAGIDLDLFIDQLSDYIDQSISFVNSMTKKQK